MLAECLNASPSSGKVGASHVLRDLSWAASKVLMCNIQALSACKTFLRTALSCACRHTLSKAAVWQV